MSDLLQTVRSQMHNLRQQQDNLYDKYVFSKIVAGASQEEMDKGYQEYEESLHGFDARSFEKTIFAILDDNTEVLDTFTDKFRSIPKYLSARNGWDAKVKDILSQDGSPQDKQGMIDALDRQRTYAHNGVISLFNSLNAYAKEKGFSEPYPHHGVQFDPQNVNHREEAAQALESQSTLLELTNNLVQEKFKETGSEQTTYEKYRSMSLGELYEIAKQSFEDSLPDAKDTSMEL